MKISANHRQTIPKPVCEALQNQALPDIVQYSARICPDLLENAVRKTTEGQHIHIQYAAGRTGDHEILLCLHRVLLRNDEKILSRRETGKRLLRFLQKPMLKPAALPGAGRAEEKMIWHEICLHERTICHLRG